MELTSDIAVIHAGRRSAFKASERVTIGRSSDCQVVVDHPTVSRLHAVLEFSGQWTLRDHHSRHGVYRDGRQTDRVAISDAVLIRLSDAHTGPMLRITATDDLGTMIVPAPTVGRVINIGRAPSNDLKLDEVLSSRFHARVRWSGGNATVDDLGSLNGTFVNGTRIIRASIFAGDVLTIGNHDFTVLPGDLVPTRRGQADGLDIRSLAYVLPSGRSLLNGIDLRAARGVLTAVIGPSGAGKSTLSAVLTGSLVPSAGAVLFDGQDVHRRYELLRTRIGFVPQADVVHRLLTIQQALEYAARLRLPPDTPAAERTLQVDAVVRELGLMDHVHTRIGHLSGGQRKRVSVALELLTEPALLVLDEPTSGLDPALDRQLMNTFRRLADGNRAVVVVTHSVAQLNACDQVLLLAPGGAAAYVGPPQHLLPTLGAHTWADAFAQVTADPLTAAQHHRAQHPPRPWAEDAFPAQAAPLDGTETATPVRGQWKTVAARQFRLIAADHGYLAFLMLLPVVLAVLTLLVPGSGSLASPSPDNPAAASQIIVILAVGACFMGAALTVRDLVGEKEIYERERAAGLSPVQYLLAKVGVCGVVVMVQSAVLIAPLIARGLPDHGLFGSSTLEILLAIMLTAWSSACWGLLISASVRSPDQVMPALVVLVMVQLVLCGGVITVNGRPVLEQVSWSFPARWGFAAVADVVNLRALNPTATADPTWRHEGPTFAVALLLLVILGACAVALVLPLLRRVADER